MKWKLISDGQCISQLMSLACKLPGGCNSLASGVIQIEHEVQSCPEQLLVRVMMIPQVEGVMMESRYQGLHVDNLPAATLGNVPRHCVQVYHMGVPAQQRICMNAGGIAAVCKLRRGCSAEDPKRLRCHNLLIVYCSQAGYVTNSFWGCQAAFR